MEAGAYRLGFYQRAVFHGLAFPPTEEAAVMKWETPKAFDTRFGFEITMYISTR